MKLINVDNFLKQYSDQVCGDTIDAIDLRLALLKEPIVEAIPIKWINMWLLKNVFIWEATTMANETDRLHAIENIKYGFETMLKDWEKENESC